MANKTRSCLYPLVFAVLAAGCSQTESSADSAAGGGQGGGDQGGGGGQSLGDYFAGKSYYFYRQTDASVVTCQSGSCPDRTDIPSRMIDEECFFCETGLEVQAGRLVTHISDSTSDSLGGCTKKSSFTWPAELAVVERSEDALVGKGNGRGRVEQLGSCTNFAYTFTTDETWVFARQRLEELVSTTVFSGAPQNTSLPKTTYIIDAPGWANPPVEPLVYSHFGITVTVASPYAFQVVPEVRLVRIEGHRLNTSALKVNRTVLDASSTRFNFAASFNAEYVVVPLVKVLGKNGAILREIVDASEYVVRVTHSPQGDLPN